MYTYYPYTPIKCENVDPVVHNYYANNQFRFKKETFPNKFKNFYRCPIILSTYHIDPYMILKKQSNGSYNMSGVDGIVFRVISQQLNFTPIIKEVPIGGLGKCKNCDECNCDEITISTGALNLVSKVNYIKVFYL